MQSQLAIQPLSTDVFARISRAFVDQIREATLRAMSLPTFKYHPDPIATGSVEPSDTQCDCCGKQRGYIYVGPVFSVEGLYEYICPWCIADGSAHTKFDAEFTDAA